MSLFRLAAGTCLLAASASAAAQSVVFTAPAQGETLRAGSVVEVSWSGLPESAAEFELLLSLDGGKHAALRLTGQLAPSGRSYLWRVPNLRADRAALVLRMGIGTREIESAPSALFQILPAPSRPVESLDWRAGELWLGGEEQARQEDPLPAAGLDSRPQRWTPPGERDDSFAPEGAAQAGTPIASRKTPIKASSAGCPRFEPPRAPHPAPLRI